MEGQRSWAMWHVANKNSLQDFYVPIAPSITKYPKIYWYFLYMSAINIIIISAEFEGKCSYRLDVLLVKEERKQKGLNIGGPLRMAHSTTWIPYILYSLNDTIHHVKFCCCVEFHLVLLRRLFSRNFPIFAGGWKSFFAVNRVIANVQTDSRCSTQAVMLLRHGRFTGLGVSDFTKCVVKQRCPLLASYWSMDGCHQNIRKSCWVLNLNVLSHGQRSAAAPVAPAGFPAHHSHQCSAERWTSAVRRSGKKIYFRSAGALVITLRRFLPMMTLGFVASSL